MLAILVITYFTNVFQMTLVFGVPFLLIPAVLYAVLFIARRSRGASPASSG